mgnify:CR=1 FL=1
MKRYPFELKEQVIKEVEEIGNYVTVGKKYDLCPKTVSYWMRQK